MTFSNKINGYIAGLLASFFWGIHSVIIRYLAEQGVSPYLIAGLRLYIGIVTIFLLLNIRNLFKRKRTKEPPIQFNKYFWIAAIFLGFNFLMFQGGLSFTLASDANLIQNFSPIAVLIIGSLVLRHRIKEIAPVQRFWGYVFYVVLVGSIGASLVLINDVNNNIVKSELKFIGDLIEFLGMIFFSIFVIYSSEFAKINTKVSSLKITMLTLLVAAIPVSFFVPFWEIAKLTLWQWELIVFIGVFSTGAAYGLWHIASKRLNVVPLTLNLVYIGIITVLSEVLFLGMSLDWKFVIGALLMISASVLAEIINKKAEKYIRHQQLEL
jgi:drug/metabolite transporter (DMT)-like permease